MSKNFIIIAASLLSIIICITKTKQIISNIENNIFYFAGKTPATVSNWNINGNKTYSNNLYYNVSTYPNDAAAVKVNEGTKVLVDAGSGPDSVAANKKVYPKYLVLQLGGK